MTASSQNSNKKSKRLDLQGIRGFAIISVLGFHFYPKYFPNGYLGVDQFFVLSGFLMCMLLKRSENMPIFSLITLFYSKRFKRILPLYLFVIFCSLIALYTVFPDTAIETNTQSASKAILFISNRPKTDQEDYFQMLSLAVDIFTHTWSLSVEIQFYFIVPLLFVLANRFGFNYQLVFYGFVGISSFVFYSFSNDIQAFNNVFSRIWQFVIGMVVYLVSNNNTKVYQQVNQDEEVGLIEEDSKNLEESEENVSNNSSLIKNVSNMKLKYILFLLMIYFILYPLELPVIIARPFMTISTGILMSISIDDYFLSNKCLTYIGDISYSLYLIHWPIYSYWKLTCNDNQILLVFSLFASIAIAIVIFETFEKWYLHISSKRIGALVSVLMVSNFIMINYVEIQKQFDTRVENSARLDGVTSNMTIEDAEKLNWRWNSEDSETIKPKTCEYLDGAAPYGWCRHKGLNKRNKYKMAIFGNSYTGNHGTLFYQECGYKANYLLQGTSLGCEPLYPSLLLQRCKENITDFENHIRETNPDYAFLFTRFISQGDPFPKNVTKMQDDPIYQFMKAQTMKLVKNIKKKLYILNAIPRVNGGHVGNIYKYLKSNKTLVEIDKTLVDLTLYEMARARQAELMKDCAEKCESIDYLNEFYNNSTNTFRYYDEKGFSYFTYTCHMSPHGLEKVRHIYRDICKNL